MKRVLVLDFESTGRETDKDRITEIGAVLWDPVKKSILSEVEWLLWDSSYPKIPKEVVKLNNLTDEKLEKEGQDPEECLIKLQKTIKEVDHVVAFNKKFDQNLFISECNRHALTIPDTPWVCGLFDLPYPKRLRGRYLKLMYLALEHGITVDPTKLHRATEDVKLLVQILEKYNWGDLLEYYNTPTVKVRADTQYEQRQLAKDAGFRWDPDNRYWWKEIKQNELGPLRDSCTDFYVGIIEDEVPDVP